MHTGNHLSKEFFELVKAIGESRSKQEEDKIILNELALLKATINQPGVPLKKMKEFMIRAVYVEMLGHDCSLAYIHAVKLCNEKQIMAKRIGYLACNIFLHKDHEFMLLLINTLQRDLKSSNHLEVAGSLVSICRLVNTEMTPAILPEVLKCLTHSHESVRKKAIIALHKIYKLDSSVAAGCNDAVRKVLCDQDPSVMGASLYMLHDLAKSNTSGNKDLVPSFVSILKQIVDHRLPREFDYHRVPAPWIQINLISILGTLGAADQKVSEQMYPLLADVMKKCDTGVNVGHAILYECVKTITKIYPHPPLLEQAAQSVSKFISSDNHNLKYLGVTGLAAIVQMNPKYAAEHQMVVVDCLEDPDETLKRKTLDLLYKMSNPQNCTVVAEKLLFHLQTSQDQHLRKELTQRVCTLAERYAPSNEWYIETMSEVFQLGGDLLPPSVSHNLMRFVAEGTGMSDEDDKKLRTFCVNSYVKILEKGASMKRCPDVLVQVIAWVLGEYGSLCTVDGYSVGDISDLLCESLSRSLESNETRSFIISALTKLVAQNESLRNDSSVEDVIERYSESRSTDLQQRCYELKHMLETAPRVVSLVLPYDAACEDISVDPKLRFLDSYVNRYGGDQRYLTKEERAKAKAAISGASGAATTGAAGGASNKSSSLMGDLNFAPYEAPNVGPKAPGMQVASSSSSFGSSAQSSTAVEASGGARGPQTGDSLGGIFDSASSANGRPGGLNIQGAGGAKKWGPSGYNNPAGGMRTGAVTSSLATAPAASVVSSAPSPSAPSAPARPTAAALAKQQQQEKKMSEKERMAAALFSGMVPGAQATATTTSSFPQSGGLSNLTGGQGDPISASKGGAKSGGSSGASTTTDPTSSSPADEILSTSNNKPEVDLLGGGDSPTPQKLQTVPSISSSGGEDLLSDDLLGLGSSGPPESSTTSAVGTASGGGGGIDDLLSLDVAPASATNTGPPSRGAATGSSGPPAAFFSPASRAGVSGVVPTSTANNILTPLSITIDVLGAEWPSLPVERKANVPVPARGSAHLATCAAFVARLEAYLNVRRVEIIGQEAISAGLDAAGRKCFLHAHVSPGAVSVAIKSMDATVADAVVTALQSPDFLN
ncbi:unnamed protein product [Amoebophrya sp. A25]|nr:unnamed protein product [Amoebophrya sp. A25]|eukprot:GSA25T00026093001.1